ncbi:MAG: glycosyltransferase family 2 protein [Pseudomonadota bacterium]
MTEMNQAVRLDANNKAMLCIVIPAYRGKYLGQALSSLAGQEASGNFEILIADDHSPDDIVGVAAPFLDTLPIRYHRFENNLGGSNLIDHWNRTIQLVSADWLWFMGDDDELEANAVSAVLSAIHDDQHFPGLWHLDVDQIDAQGHITSPKPPYPDHLSARNYALGRFRGTLSSFACEYIVRRDALLAMGGFVNFPHAWCSDDATWLKLAAKGGIRTIKGPKARWRLSGDNISAGQSRYLPGKVEAMLQYLAWLAHNLATLPQGEHDPTDHDILEAGLAWYFQRIYDLGADQALPALVRQAWRLHQSTGAGLIETVLRSVRVNRWIRSKRN